MNAKRKKPICTRLAHIPKHLWMGLDVVAGCARVCESRKKAEIFCLFHELKFVPVDDNDISYHYDAS